MNCCNDFRVGKSRNTYPRTSPRESLKRGCFLSARRCITQFGVDMAASWKCPIEKAKIPSSLDTLTSWYSPVYKRPEGNSVSGCFCVCVTYVNYIYRNIHLLAPAKSCLEHPSFIKLLHCLIIQQQCLSRRSKPASPPSWIWSPPSKGSTSTRVSTPTRRPPPLLATSPAAPTPSATRRRRHIGSRSTRTPATNAATRSTRPWPGPRKRRGPSSARWTGVFVCGRCVSSPFPLLIPVPVLF